MRPSKKWLIVLVVMLAALIVFSLKPLPKASAENCASVKGKMVAVKKGGGPADIVLTMKGDDGYYYINRGLEYGIKLNELTDQLLNKIVTVHYIRNRSLLNFNSKTRHVARIETGGSVIYNEWGDD